MAEVVYNSLQYLSDDDTRAMAVYLKSIAQSSPPASRRPRPSRRQESSLLMSLGKTVYDARCASCHGAQGEGKPPHYPPLAGNQSIQMESAVNAIRMVLNGGFPPGTAGNPMPYGMPPFAQLPVRQRGRGRRDLHPHGLGQPRHRGRGPRGQRAALGTARLR